MTNTHFVIYTLNGCGKNDIQEVVYLSADAARRAWIDAGKPRAPGGDVWIARSERRGCIWVETETITIS